MPLSPSDHNAVGALLRALFTAIDLARRLTTISLPRCVLPRPIFQLNTDHLDLLPFALPTDVPLGSLKVVLPAKGCPARDF